MENIQKEVKKVAGLKNQLYTLVSNKVTENDLATADERETRMKTTNVITKYLSGYSERPLLPFHLFKTKSFNCFYKEKSLFHRW